MRKFAISAYILSNTISAVNIDHEVLITATREKQNIQELDQNPGKVNKEEIAFIKAKHPSDITNRVSGVHVNVTNGEGHMTAIRQPMSTSPVYLFLEDGVPIRSTGFFNHNALYETNITQSRGVEVFKGPSSSLYGSDAVAGTINVLTTEPLWRDETKMGVEFGSDNRWKTLFENHSFTDNAALVSTFNFLKTDGYREGTDFERVTGNIRWDHFLNDNTKAKTVLSYSNIDQATAGSSRVNESDYFNRPETNYTPISYRKVQALRISTNVEKELDNKTVSNTYYFRDNSMSMLPNWSLSYDPNEYTTQNHSFGYMFKVKKDNLSNDGKFIFGLDFDFSPGSRVQNKVTATKVNGIYTSYTSGAVQYDYDVNYTGLSGYLHYENRPFSNKKFKTISGLRADFSSYDYENHLSTLTTGTHMRPASTKVNFDHLSPKFGLVYQINDSSSWYTNYNHGFRVPSESQLFRQGRSVNTIDLDAIKVNSTELGYRKKFEKLVFNTNVYHMVKNDDILSYRDAANNRFVQNAGKTKHKGFEIDFTYNMDKKFSFDGAFSHSKHYFVNWSPKPTVSYANNEQSSAPRTIGFLALNYQNDNTKYSLEWSHLGDYFTNDDNTMKYSGHNLLNLRSKIELSKSKALFFQVSNLLDKKYANAVTGKTSGNEYAPGASRSFNVGYEVKF
ncbi:MAG: TonB-dependent receptor [Candidatus Cloacimonetes bacterium]|nr:TonB-dependent receptor [Candidatus Cloacimonadota bacterium]